MTCAIQIYFFYHFRYFQRPITPLLIELQVRPLHFWKIVQAWTPYELEVFLAHFKLDYIYPFFYSLFLFGLLIKTKQKFSYTPLIAGICDWVENTCTLLVIKNSTLPSFIIVISGLMSWLKWSLILVSIFKIMNYFLAGAKPRF